MGSDNLNAYMPILILMVFAVVAVVGALMVSRLIRPSNPTKLKTTAYECGEMPHGEAWSNFNVRFYVVSLIFIVFDVEAALMFPVAVVFRRFHAIELGEVVLSSFLLFIAILVVGVVYCWKKGDLDWVRSFNVGGRK